LAENVQELAEIDEAILTMERLALGRGKRRGRPPKWMAAAKPSGRPRGSKNKPRDKLLGQVVAAG
jgi:hypothetical protein